MWDQPPSDTAVRAISAECDCLFVTVDDLSACKQLEYRCTC